MTIAAKTKRSFAIGGLVIAWLVALPSPGFPQTRLEEAPINYLETQGQNPVRELMDKVDSGELILEYEPGDGYLRSILQELGAPISSQALVFSKTSLQSGRISPQNPRAIYFSDDVYIGWVRGSSLLEIATADPQLGAVYYTFQMSPQRVFMRRENYRCLGCHEKTVDHGKLPMHMIRSVMARDNGNINLLLKDYATDHTSPIEERWGGWYVTGEHGDMTHLGNAFLKGEEAVSLGPSTADTLQQQFDLSMWPTPSSDIVALMVMEHQAEMQNRFADANYAVRRARFVSESDDQADGQSLQTTVHDAAELVVEHLLFSGEAALSSEIKCSNSFTTDFAAKGPRTEDGKSLRDFDLKTRMFRYPCSYLIYSKVFDALEPELKSEVYQQLWQVLTNQDQSPKFAHLSVQDRSAILDILRKTKTGLPQGF